MQEQLQTNEYKVGDIRSGKELGYKNKNKYIYAFCKNCYKTRWVNHYVFKSGNSRHCQPCHLKKKAANQNQKNAVKKAKAKNDLSSVYFSIYKKHKTEGYNCFLNVPISNWVSDCNYVKISVDKKFNQLRFTPINKKIPNSRRALRYFDRYKILVPNKLSEVIENGFGQLFVDGPQIIIQFDGPELLPEFQLWLSSESGLTLKNIYEVYTAFYKNHRYLSIASYMWPENAPFAYLEWKNNVLSLIPVSPTGMITDGKKLGMYVDTEECIKLKLIGKRLYGYIYNFYTTNPDLPEGYWAYRNTGKNGELRFKFVKPRESKDDQVA
jgi:hypothetical protein